MDDLKAIAEWLVDNPIHGLVFVLVAERVNAYRQLKACREENIKIIRALFRLQAGHDIDEETTQILGRKDKRKEKTDFSTKPERRNR